MNRRLFLQNTAAMAAGIATAGLLGAAPAGKRSRVLRVAHLTDMHVTADAPGLEQPEEGLTAAIRHAQGQADPPEMLFFGGDMVMDSLKLGKEATLAQWAVWNRIFAAEVRLPHRFVLGNHDVWGWAVHDNPSWQDDPDYGKGLAKRMLGLSSTYYTFDHAGWHFIALDSLEVNYASKYGYLARLDDEQFQWLARDLAATPAQTPVCVISHVPIVAVCSLVDQHLFDAGVLEVPGILTHLDALRIKNLFNRHPNVKLCLGGHIHLADDFHYRGVRYCCNGAVSGNWWKGTYEEYGPAYALVDFYDDGSVENQLVPYRLLD